jgi:serine/threonine protein phosphatase 1
MKIKSAHYTNRYVISDIHGCKNSLVRLIQRINPTPDDALFFLGDYIDRGPDSSGVLDYIMSLEKSAYNIYTLRGNHEQDFLDAENEYDAESFFRFAKKRLKSADLLNKSRKIKKTYKRFMEATDMFYELEDFFLVHAGFNFEKEDIFSDKSAMLRIRNQKVDLTKTNGKPVVHGHQPTYFSKIQKAVEARKKRLPLDNGCVYKKRHKIYDTARLGRLCCLNLNTYELMVQNNID